VRVVQCHCGTCHPVRAGKDVYWYTREKKQDGDGLDDELRAVKGREEQLMAEVWLLASADSA
jgi:NADH:ubiquinone oxidoreductase subunit F (NADH-binding)